MKHYVLGFVFNITGEKILLMRKNKPEWQAGKWNGIGGKIKGQISGEVSELPDAAMKREGYEETQMRLNWTHYLTFICPGGTVFIYKAIDNLNCCHEKFCDGIHFKQDEKSLKEGTLDIWRVDSLPDNIMRNLSWIVPICSANDVQYPVLIQENTLGVE